MITKPVKCFDNLFLTVLDADIYGHPHPHGRNRLPMPQHLYCEAKTMVDAAYDAYYAEQAGAYGHLVRGLGL